MNDKPKWQGERLRRLRLDDLGMTQDDLAREIGCKREVISRAERGVTEPSPMVRRELDRLAKETERKEQSND